MYKHVRTRWFLKQHSSKRAKTTRTMYDTTICRVLWYIRVALFGRNTSRMVGLLQLNSSECHSCFAFWWFRTPRPSRPWDCSHHFQFSLNRFLPSELSETQWCTSTVVCAIYWKVRTTWITKTIPKDPCIYGRSKRFLLRLPVRTTTVLDFCLSVLVVPAT